MSTATVPATTKQEANLPAIAGPRLPFHPLVEERFGIDRASWKALVEVIFLGAQTVETVILALSYCKARKLDPFKRNVHIVPVWNSQMGCLVDTIWPGIGELRTTAFRTGEYAGRGETVFGPDKTEKIGTAEITYPEWAQVTVKRIIQGRVVDFCGPRVYWIETYAVTKRNDDTPNQMWRDRPRGQIDKCAEAAALRSAFPEEIGNDISADEVNPFMTAPKGTVNAGNGKPSNLEELTRKLEAAESAPQQLTPENSEELPEETNYPESPEGSTDEEPLSEKFTAFKAKLDSLDSILEVNQERARFAADDPDEDDLKNQLCDAALERIHGSRGANSNKKGGKQ